MNPTTLFSLNEGSVSSIKILDSGPEERLYLKFKPNILQGFRSIHILIDFHSHLEDLLGIVNLFSVFGEIQ